MKTFILTLFLVIVSLYNYAQTPWQVDVDTVGMLPYYDNLYESYDKGLVFLGCAYPGAGSKLIKLDANGKVLYNRIITVDKPWKQIGVNTVTPAKDGGIYISGGIWATDTLDYAFVTKLNPCGDIAWSYYFKDNIDEYDAKYITTVSELENGNLLLVANTSGNVMFITINDSGVIQSQTSLFSSHTNFGNNMIKTTYGEYILTGDKGTHRFIDTTDTVSELSRTLLVRLDSVGKLICYYVYSLTDDSVSIGGYVTEYKDISNSLYILGAGKGSINRMYLKKCTTNGTEIWHKNISEKPQWKASYYETPRGIFKQKDNNLLIIESKDFGNFYGLSFARMIKINANGDLLDSVTLGDSANYYNTSSGTETYDSCFVVSYSHYHTNHFDGHIQLRKFDQNLKQVNFKTSNFTYDSLCPHSVRVDDINLTTIIKINLILDSSRIYKAPYYCTPVTSLPNIFNNISSIKVWPNPSGKWLKVDKQKSNDITTAELYDLTGKLLLRSRLAVDGIIDIEQLPQGVYVLSLYNSNGDKWNAKVVKE